MEQPKSVENPAADLNKSVQELSQKILEADKLTKEEIQTRVKEHENLASQQVQAFKSLEDAKKKLSHFKERQQAGDFQDEQSRQLIEELERTVGSAQDSFQAADKRIGDLAKRPDVMDKLHDSANVDRGKELEKEQSVQECISMIDRVAELREKEKTQYKEANESLYKKSQDSFGAFRNKIREAEKIATGDIELRQLLESLAGSREPHARKLFEEIQQYKSNLGFFDRAKKNMIDDLSKTLPGLMDDAFSAQKEQEKMTKQYQATSTEAGSLVRELRHKHNAIKYSNGDNAAAAKIEEYSKQKLGKGIYEIRD